MTRISRKAIWTIVLVAFVVGVIVFILWGSQGCKNWDASTWFDYWGKGAPTTQKERDEQPQSKAAANAGLTHDSELSEAVTVSVKQYDQPTISMRENGFVFTCDGAHGNAIDVKVYPFMGSQYVRAFSLSDTLGERYGEMFLSFEDLYAAVGEGAYTLQYVNVGSGEYKDSTLIGQTFYVLSEAKHRSVMEMTGTHVKIPFPAGPENTNYSQYYSIKIKSSDGKINNTYNSNVESTDGLYTVVKTDDEEYVDIDLTQLPFIDQIVPQCSITAELTYKTSYYTWLATHYCSSVSFSISKLAAPTNVKYTDGVISWNAVTGAEGYAVFDGDELYNTVKSPSLSIAHSNLEVGEHTMRIRALGNVGSALASSAKNATRMTAFNTSSSITQLVALTFVINDDSITKLVPYGSEIGDYVYEVLIPGKVFGGWFYDNGYSVAVTPEEKLSGDMTIYARLMDEKVTVQSETWWEQYKWYVLGPIIGLAAVGLIAGVAVSVKKRKAA